MACLFSFGSVGSLSLARASLALAALCGGLASTVQTQIIETNSGSLTSYLAGKSRVQDAKPLHRQRGVSLDGSMRRGSTFPMAIAGNPFESAWRGDADQNGVRLDTGTWSPTIVDLSLPAPGFRWNVGRVYNARQDNSGQYDSASANGIDWFGTSQPEIVFYDDAANSLDEIYVLSGCDRYAEYKRTGSSSNEFKGTNGAAGISHLWGVGLCATRRPELMRGNPRGGSHGP